MQVNWLNLWVGGSSVVLIGSEIVACAVAAAWALAGLAHLAPTVSYILIVATIVPALLATAKFAQMVHSVEPFFERKTVTTAEVDAASASPCDAQHE